MMKNYQKILAVLALSGLCFAAPMEEQGHRVKKSHPQAESAESKCEACDAIHRLEEKIEAQQAEIDALKSAQQMQPAAAPAPAPSNDQAAAAAAEAAAQANAKVDSLRQEVDGLKAVSQNTALTLQETQKDFKGEIEKNLSGLAHGDVKFGATFFGDFAAYPNGAYAPAFLDNQNTLPGPGVTDNNAFDIRRAYLNIFYTPNDRVTLRVTPDLFINADGSRAFRLKYGYLEVKNIFPKDSAFGKSALRIGQTQMPLIDFSEGLMGFRYAYKTPWDYMGLSSTFVGAAMKGPIMFHGKEYLDYHLGIFNVAGYHASEVNAEKQAQARLTIYPMGTKKDGHGLGITLFDGYGYSAASTGASAQNRGSAMVHYVSDTGKYRAIFEYDFGRNALSTKQVTGSGALADFHGVDTAGVGTWMQSFDAFGSAGLGKTPFSLFGIWQYVQPNTDISSNPMNFQRVVGGIEYKVNKQFRLALTSENYLHSGNLAGAVTTAGGTAAEVSRATQDFNGAMVAVEYNY